MPVILRHFAAAAAVAFLVAVAVARAETWTLELKQRESKNPESYDSQESYMYWATSGQRFFVQMTPPGSRIRIPENEAQTADFKRIVKKEPKYECDRPFRGVVKLGSQEYAFALDVAPPKSEANDEKPKKKEKEGVKKETDQPKADAAAGKPEKNRGKAASSAKKNPYAYNRLYFDFNHNGDLTDDKVVEAKAEQLAYTLAAAQSYSRIQFPRVDVTIDAGGTPLKYSFFLSGYVVSSSDFSYASLSLNTAVLRRATSPWKERNTTSCWSISTATAVSTTRARFTRTPPVPTGRSMPNKATCC